MILFKTIDNLFIGTRYGVWGMSILGIPLSLILLFCNFSFGLGAVLACLAAFLISSSLTLFLAPKIALKNDFWESKQYIMAGIFCTLSLVCMGISFLVSNGLPAMNLIFM